MQGRISRRLASGFWVGTVLATILLLGSLLGGATVAIAAEPGADAAETDGDGDPAKAVNSDNEKWQPSLSMGFVLSYQDQEGSNNAGLGFGDPGTSDGMVSPGFRFDASLASPVLFESLVGPFAPRVFAQVGTQLLLEDNFVAWRSIFTPPATSTTNETLVKSSVDSQWYLGVGLEFLIPAGERDIRLRTSVDYMSQTLSASGTSDSTTRQSGNTVERHYESPVAETTNHALGVGVAAEADVYSWRDMRVSLFLETRFAWLMDQNTMTLRAVSADPLDLDFSEFTVTPGAFIAQGGGGIRIRWVPVW
ncbi:MAG TPA: hypothetical protein EYQ54_02085 [Myxococcales bacterium]|nr:hypothetical protein [Myxococcales bacterium]